MGGEVVKEGVEGLVFEGIIKRQGIKRDGVRVRVEEVQEQELAEEVEVEEVAEGVEVEEVAVLIEKVVVKEAGFKGFVEEVSVRQVFAESS
jgi:hypothetical protein